MEQEYAEISAKTVSEAITEACRKFGVTSDRLDYQVVEEGSSGFLGIGSRPALIRAAVKVEKLSMEDVADRFLGDVFKAMNMAVAVDIKYNEEEKSLEINLMGEDMGEGGHGELSSEKEGNSGKSCQEYCREGEEDQKIRNSGTHEPLREKNHPFCPSGREIYQHTQRGGGTFPQGGSDI